MLYPVSSYTIGISQEVIHINIELKSTNKIKIFFQSIHSALEDILFSAVLHIPESFLPVFLMNWLDRYTTKRSQELQQEIIRQQWKQVSLEKAVEEIHSRSKQDISDWIQKEGLPLLLNIFPVCFPCINTRLSPSLLSDIQEPTHKMKTVSY